MASWRLGRPGHLWCWLMSSLCVALAWMGTKVCNDSSWGHGFGKTGEGRWRRCASGLLGT